MRIKTEERLKLAEAVFPWYGWYANDLGIKKLRKYALVSSDKLKVFCPEYDFNQLFAVLFFLSDKVDPTTLGTACDSAENILGLAIEYVMGRLD